MGSAYCGGVGEAEFAFFLHGVEDLHDAERRFALSAEDIAALNPNTKTAPVFRTRRDAEISRQISRQVPILALEVETRNDCWGFAYREVIHMSHLSEHFVLPTALGESGNLEELLPLYEAKMIHHFDHRWMSFDEFGSDEDCIVYHSDPLARAHPRYWIPRRIVDERMGADWTHA